MITDTDRAGSRTLNLLPAGTSAVRGAIASGVAKLLRTPGAGAASTSHSAARAVDAPGRVGGGGAPEHPLPGVAVSLPVAFAELLRLGARPVVGYVEDGRTLLNLRSLLPTDDDALTEAVLEVAEKWT